MELKLKNKKKTQGKIIKGLWGEKNLNINRIKIFYRDQKTEEMKFYGSYRWNGNEWYIDTCFERKKFLNEQLNDGIFFMDENLTKYDLDFCVPLYMLTPSDELAELEYLGNEIKTKKK